MNSPHHKNLLDEELPVEVIARNGIARAVSGTLLGHKIGVVRLESDSHGIYQCHVFRSSPAIMPRWDGIVSDLCVKQAQDGCRPCFGDGVPKECKSCIAQTALRQASISRSRVDAQDACEDAQQMMTQRDGIVDALTRQLLLHREVAGTDIERELWPTGDPVNTTR